MSSQSNTMQTTIQYIKKELANLYPHSEVQAFVQIIFEYVCALDYTGLILNREKEISTEQYLQVEKIVRRLKTFEPIQYIIGETDFLGMKLKVNPSVLIPRPETEELVQWISEISFSAIPGILDIGTGSGCIALALKKQIPNASVFALDVSEKALQTAMENALNNKLYVEYIHFDILNWRKREWPSFDVVVSNPPYVRELEKKQMDRNVLDFEPSSALFVDDGNPLIFYREIGMFAHRYLKPEGKLFFEINENLGDEMSKLMEDLAFKQIEIRKDINGKERMLKCER